MFSKLTVLFCAFAAILSSPLQVTPEDLNLELKTLGDNIKVRESQVQYEIKIALNPLNYYIHEAELQYISDLVPAAKPYWDVIGAYETKNISTDIVDCINRGNNQLYQLNNTIVDEGRLKLNQLSQQGQNKALESRLKTSAILTQLEELSGKIAHCSDNSCAGDLHGKLLEFYEYSIQYLDTAADVMVNFVYSYLPEILPTYGLDVSDYQKRYQPFLDEVLDCVANK
ncbi:unnamed protein product [Ceutorhynchus assimilis]|uniref:Uncharacterized protein n=1 Tax=Ceutorhynchus assimilis TaxID=467358 RepID=A0A9N9MJ61_9CUCU|nr:unnamed protein product [Ceutorhynchus assimilis]